ncbi:MAG: family 2A encapsulin nanocompartment cargo protein cysteine desulfurase [Kofleriaceae bacterium]
MSIELPPHELRGLAGNLVDKPDDARLPSSAASTPGLASAAASPAAVVAPSFAADDPGSIAALLAQMAGELGVPASVVPIPAPERVMEGLGLPSTISPAVSPVLLTSGEPIAPQLGPMDAVSGAPSNSSGVPSSGSSGAPSFGSSSNHASELPAALWSSSFADDDVPASLPVELVPNAPTGTPVPSTTFGAPSAGTPMTGNSGLPSSGGAPAPGGNPFSSPLMFDASLFGIPDGDTRVPFVDAPDAAAPTRIESGREPIRQNGAGAFDPYLVRKDFPILEERVHGKRLVWLDNGATTQKPRAVIDRLTRYYEHENSNVHRAAHALAARATDAFESARETTRKFLNAPSTSEIIFVRGATEGINLVAKTWGKRHIERGDEIVLTHLEHHANIVPWQQLCAETGARLRVAPVDDRGDVILEEYEKLLCSKTKLVAFTQVSNALGTITPAKQIIESARRWGACTLLDGAQAVSHMPVDVQALDCDFYVFSGHKVFAPTGIGAVFGKRAILDAMPPWQGGGNMIADVTFEKTVYQAPPWRFEAGTGNIADAAGMGAALDYVMRIGMATIDRYEHELLGYATEQLRTVPGLRMIGTAREKAGVMSFVLDGKRTEDVGAALDKDGIAVRSGHHCAQPILRRFGLEATVRASLAFYNVREDIDALVSSLKRLQSSSV